jgi:hypothetical protein
LQSQPAFTGDQFRKESSVFGRWRQNSLGQLQRPLDVVGSGRVVQRVPLVARNRLGEAPLRIDDADPVFGQRDADVEKAIVLGRLPQHALVQWLPALMLRRQPFQFQIHGGSHHGDRPADQQGQCLMLGEVLGFDILQGGFHDIQEVFHEAGRRVGIVEALFAQTIANLACFFTNPFYDAAQVGVGDLVRKNRSGAGGRAAPAAGLVDEAHQRAAAVVDHQAVVQVVGQQPAADG